MATATKAILTLALSENKQLQLLERFFCDLQTQWIKRKYKDAYGSLFSVWLGSSPVNVGTAVQDHPPQISPGHNRCGILEQDTDTRDLLPGHFICHLLQFLPLAVCAMMGQESNFVCEHDKPRLFFYVIVHEK